MGTVVSISGAKEAPKAAQSRMDTIIVTQAMVAAWKIPPFQRPLRINDKVRMVTEQVKRDEVIEGVLTLGKLKHDNSLYIVDGQHRVEAFKLSEIGEAIADVRVVSFADMSEMADEFVRLNSSLVKMRPDDILRGLESSVSALQSIRKNCSFVGYDQIRRGGGGPIVSMSALLRCWYGGRAETPTNTGGGLSTAGQAHALDAPALQSMIAFLSTAHAAWGRDPEYFRLWGNLNLTLCMWMWNRLVMDTERSGNKRYVVLSINQFKHCLMQLSADGDYLAWLPGRILGDRDRSPCYGRIKANFVKRLSTDQAGKKVMLPQPAWSSK